MLINPTKPIILSLCDLSGIMINPWQDSHHCVTIDLAHPWTKEVNISRLDIKADIVNWKYPDNWELPEIVFAFPPCTDVAVSGARHFKEKGLKRLINSLIILDKCIELCEIASKFALLENPVSTFSTYWRKPDFTFHPWHYAGYLDSEIEQKSKAYAKETCIWSFGDFNKPVSKPRWDYKKNEIRDIQFTSYEDRQKKRSLTPKGFAKAVYLANKD